MLHKYNKQYSNRIGILGFKCKGRLNEMAVLGFDHLPPTSHKKKLLKEYCKQYLKPC